jgi:hypothetical protein
MSFSTRGLSALFVSRQIKIRFLLVAITGVD